jgi:hypothetical protein
MTDHERSLIFVRGHRPQRVPAEIAHLPTSVVAVVLSTERSDRKDAIVDHELWFACMEAVGVVVGATSSEVVLEPRRGFLPRLLPRWLLRRKTPAAGALPDYMARLRAGEDLTSWQTVLWRKDGQVIAAATCERWYLVGGPSPYQDSYTTSICLGRQAAARLIPVLQVSVERAGGRIDGMIDAPSAA